MLADTSVWVAHMRHSKFELVENLASENVLMHMIMMGELACGNIRDRSQRLIDWEEMPMAARSFDEEVFEELEARRLMGPGIAFCDAHLRCPVLERRDTPVLTYDRRLKRVASDLGITLLEQDA